MAAKSSGRVGAAQALVQPSGDLDEDRIAGRVSMLGVDSPEVLEFHRDHAHHVALPISLGERSLDAVDEQHAVGELGERVVKRAIGKLALKSGEPEQPLVQAASLDGHGDDCRQLLEMPIEAG